MEMVIRGCQKGKLGPVGWRYERPQRRRGVGKIVSRCLACETIRVPHPGFLRSRRPVFDWLRPSDVVERMDVLVLHRNSLCGRSAIRYGMQAPMSRSHDGAIQGSK